MFRVLASYAEWKSQKDNILTDITEQYPDVTEVEDGNTLVVRPPQSQGYVKEVFTFTLILKF